MLYLEWFYDLPSLYKKLEKSYLYNYFQDSRAPLHSQLLHPSHILLKNDSWFPLTIFTIDIFTMVLTLHVLTSWQVERLKIK